MTQIREDNGMSQRADERGDDFDEHLTRGEPPNNLDARIDTFNPAYHYMCANLRAGMSIDTMLTPIDDHVELALQDYMVNTVPPPERDLAEGEFLVLCFHASGVRRTIIERDTDILTKEEIVKHEQEVEAAMLSELQLWAKFGCMSRRPRKGAQNVIDCRWVIK